MAVAAINSALPETHKDEKGSWVMTPRTTTFFFAEA